MHHAHSIDRWDDATGSNLYEHLAGVNDLLLARDLRGCGQTLAGCQDHAAPRRPHHREDVAGGRLIRYASKKKGAKGRWPEKRDHKEVERGFLPPTANHSRPNLSQI